jgi:hypothetical protein
MIEEVTIGEVTYLKLSHVQLINPAQICEIKRTVELDSASKQQSHVKIFMSNGKEFSYKEDTDLGKKVLDYFCANTLWQEVAET